MLGGVALRDVFFNFCHNRLWIFYAKPEFAKENDAGGRSRNNTQRDCAVSRSRLRISAHHGDDCLSERAGLDVFKSCRRINFDILFADDHPIWVDPPLFLS